MNVIVVMMDTVRQDHVGAYGNTFIKTPSIDRFAEKSLVFERMYPEILPTVPARRSLFTGRRVFPDLNWFPMKGDYVVIRGWGPMRESDMTLAEILNDYGYICGLVTDCHHMFKPMRNFQRGFHSWTHIRGQVQDPFKSGPAPEELVERYIHPDLGEWASTRVIQHLKNNSWWQSEEDYFPARVFKTAAEWLKDNISYEKLFLWVDCFDPHEPWDPPQEYVDMYDPDYKGREYILPREGDSSYLAPEELNHIKARYAAEYTLVDKWMGWFMNEVEELGLLDDTVIIVMSDHGHPLGEHGIISKVPYALYPELIDIPFMIRVPGVTRGGARTNALVQFHDLAPTLIDILGLSVPKDYSYGGKSFSSVLENDNSSFRDHIVLGYHDCALVMNGEWAYIFTQDPSMRRLFHISVDSEWVNDLHKSNTHIVNKMHRLLEEVADPDDIRVPPEIAKKHGGVESSQ